jgi:four helix bundle protein
VNNEQVKAGDVKDRLIDFGVRIVNLSSKLPNTSAGRHVAHQILKSGTSPAPNYGEARSAESRADFVHKLGIVLKELNETLIWLKIIKRSNLIKPDLLEGLVEENLQLSKIIGSSIRTARRVSSRSSRILKIANTQ